MYLLSISYLQNSLSFVLHDIRFSHIEVFRLGVVAGTAPPANFKGGQVFPGHSEAFGKGVPV